ncbi:MAG: polysaccharide pyruvyl transferase family protein [Verrucomicrobium sp.]|nr:polysaccharide pyruvyl transferase family protein [Verrucomicrobium sp.]
MKIAFVGASGYGNVGDDTYPLVFRAQLPEADLISYNSTLPADLPEDLDLLVLGGGGILYYAGTEGRVESSHFDCMRFYMDRAQERGIPWGILSCGFQFGADRHHHFAVDLAPWGPYLQQARFITLRSPECVRMAKALSGREEGIHFFPDAGYLYQPSTPVEPVPKVLTLIPAGFINPRNAHVRYILRHYQSMNYEIVWMGMGSPGDDDRYFVEAAEWQPTALHLPQPGPAKAYAQIARSRMVYSGRYHGMVFARQLGVPFYVPDKCPYKIEKEDLTADPSLAAGHFKVLREVMSTL